MYKFLILLVPLSLFGTIYDNEGEPATIHIEGRYIIIKTDGHTFQTLNVQHSEDCECGGSWGENLNVWTIPDF